MSQYWGVVCMRLMFGNKQMRSLEEISSPASPDPASSLVTHRRATTPLNCIQVCSYEFQYGYIWALSLGTSPHIPLRESVSFSTHEGKHTHMQLRDRRACLQVTTRPRPSKQAWNNIAPQVVDERDYTISFFVVSV